MGGSNEKYVLALAGDDGRVLNEHAQKVERELRTLPGIGAVTSSSSLVRPELIVRPDFAGGRSGRLVGRDRRHAAHRHCGRLRPGLAKLNLSQRQMPMVVKLSDDARQDFELLKRLTVPGAHGPVMLANVASIELGSGPAQIDRYDRVRNVNIEVELNGQPLGEVEAKTMEAAEHEAAAARRRRQGGGRRRGDGRAV
jgi:multidrug efflux pump subunit AcrB